MSYDSLYPPFRSAPQARNRLGCRLRRSHPAMPRLRTRFDHRPRTPPQTGARRASRLDRHPSRSLPWLREHLHLPAMVFAPLHALQPAGSLSSIASTLWGALLLGGGYASAQGSQSRARSLHPPPLGPRPGSFSTRSFLSAPNAGPLRSLADARQSVRPRGWAVVGADSDSADALAPASLRNFSFAHHPCLGVLAAFAYAGLQRPNSTMGEDLVKIKQCLSLLDYLRQQNWTARPVGLSSEFVGLCPLHPETAVTRA